MILEQPGITNQGMAKRLGLEKSAIHWHINKFLRDGIVVYSQDGKFKRYFLDDKSLLVLEKHTDRPN